MAINPGAEFRIVASPTQAQLRHLLYLAEQDNGSVLTAGARSPGVSDERSKRDSERAVEAIQTQAMIQAARLADPEYQAMSARINADLDDMDERSVIALQEIEYALTDLNLRREQMREEAYRDGQDRAIFMAEDGSAAFYEDGTQVDENTFLQIRGDLAGKPSIEAFRDLQRREDELTAHRDKIHAGMEAGDELREEIANGEIPCDEAERRAQDILESRAGVLDAAEEALLNVRGDAQAPGHTTAPAERVDAAPAALPTFGQSP